MLYMVPKKIKKNKKQLKVLIKKIIKLIVISINVDAGYHLRFEGN